MYVSDIIQIMILGFALGSVPSGVLLARAFGLPDPRYIGSGNIGATNMLRTGNKKVAALTLLLDMLKGAASVWLSYQLFATSQHPEIESRALATACEAMADAACMPHHALAPALSAFAVLAAAIGHMVTPWLKFKGGKGVATLFGGVLAFSWPVGMAAFFVWLIVLFVKRYVSLASVVALGVAPLVAWLRVDAPSAFVLAIAAAIAIWKHRENIKRLRKGFEPHIHFSKGSHP